ncbi:hypothetical protein BH10PSE4_BH10PSE4_39580 [soil metagenome]
MVFRTAGAGWLALMMRAERTRSGVELDTDWLLYGPTDPDAVEDDETPLQMAAE